MENQSTNNNTDKPVEHKVLCRKCGGPHFTIKCGKEKQPEQPEQTTKKQEEQNNNEHTKKEIKETKHFGDKKQWDKNNKHHDSNNKYHDSNYKNQERRPYFKTTYRVKIGELPTDMTEEEMMELTCDWGHVVRIRVNNYPESSTAYVDFVYEEEADYFVKAIDKTPFGFLVISAQRVESFRSKTNGETDN